MVFPGHLLPFPQLWAYLTAKFPHSYLTNEETEAHTSNDLLQGPQLVSGEYGIQSHSIHTSQMIPSSPDPNDGQVKAGHR